MDKRRLLLIVICSFASAYLLRFASRHAPRSAAIEARNTEPAAAVSAGSRALRPQYPYSVIPGGAYSAAELRRAVERDPLIHAHYADFNLNSVHLVRLKEDRFQFVSYRRQDRIYWTRRKLRIPKGEVLLTDGINFARTRCGNRVSAKLPGQTSVAQPPERLLSLPPFTPTLLTKGDVKLGPAPAVAELPPTAPPLPFELPRLAPYIPSQYVSSLPVAQQIWPSLAGYPPLQVVASNVGPPGGPEYTPEVTPGPGLPTGITHGFPAVPVTPLPGANEVPEPATLSLFAATLCGLLWLLTRVVRRAQLAPERN